MMMTSLRCPPELPWLPRWDWQDAVVQNERESDPTRRMLSGAPGLTFWRPFTFFTVGI